MGYKRNLYPDVEPSEEQLTSDMAGIGMHFAAAENREANIENTILFASFEGMERHDLRTLSVLCMWLGTYASWINADRITKLAKASRSTRVRAFWTAVAIWKKKDVRFKRLSVLYKGPRVDIPRDGGVEFHLSRHGEDQRFQDGPVRVPDNVLRKRKMDVVPPGAIQRHNLFIRYRIMMGPTYRADMWATLDLHQKYSPAELARCTYGSFATAWQVKREWRLINEDRSVPVPVSF